MRKTVVVGHGGHPRLRWSGMLYDKRAQIFVQGGGGGDGCVSLPPRGPRAASGGPDGGDGGRGGDVVLLCDDSLRDLQAFRRSAHFKAPSAAATARARSATAPTATTLVVRVPPGHAGASAGTAPRYDLVAPGQRAVVLARGGSGGRGNKHFADRHAPGAAASPSAACRGDEGWVELQLKLLADVGLVGLPNAGKSSLLSRLTRAAPEGRRLPVHDARAGARARSTPTSASSCSPTSPG